MSSGIVITLWLGSDRLVGEFIERSNRHLVTPVKVADVEVSILRHFPLISIMLEGVRVEDSHTDKFALFEAKRVSFSFDAIDAWNGLYVIRQIGIDDSRTHIRYDSTGLANFRVFKSNFANKGDGIRIDLEDIRLTRALVTYVDAATNDSHQFRSEAMRARLAYAEGKYDIKAIGDLMIDLIRLGDRDFLRKKNFDLSLVMESDLDAASIEIRSADLRQGEARYTLLGYYDFGDEPRTDLTLEGLNTDLRAIRSFLPEQTASKLDQYRSDGDLKFRVRLSGPLDSEPGPVWEASFKCSKVSLTDPVTGVQFEDVSGAGRFLAIGNLQPAGMELHLDSLEGRLDGKPFNTSLLIRNFDEPFIDLSWKGTLQAAVIQIFLSESLITGLGGAVEGEIKLRGQLADLRSRETAEKFTAGGSLKFKDFRLSIPSVKIDLQNVNGSLALEGRLLELKAFSGKLGSSDFRIDGTVNNALSALLHEQQHLGIEASIRSRNLDADELLSIAFRGKDSTSYHFSLDPLLHLRIDFDIDRLKYNLLRPRDLSGKLELEKRQITFTESRFRGMGGKVMVDGSLDATSKTGDIRIRSEVELEGVMLDSAFYVFRDFGQDFIQSENLKGRTTAKMKIDVTLDETLQLRPEKLVADLDVLIRQGELNNFEPMLDLKRFIDDEGLRRLKFADLQNEIHVQDLTVFLPRMEIKSNLTTIQLAGRHTFDQHIDYRLVVPMTGKRPAKLSDAGEALEIDKSGKSKLFLKITGTTDKYDVAYDGAAVREKITNDIRKEAKSLRESFRSKPKPDPKRQPKLSDEEFDWENR